MARMLKHSGYTLTIEKHRESKIASPQEFKDRASIFYGDELVATVSERADGRYVGPRNTVSATLDQAIRAAAKDVVARLVNADVDKAHASANFMEAERVEHKRRNAERKARREEAEREEAHRRATLPMLTVTYDARPTYMLGDLGDVPARPYEVRVYGGARVTIYLESVGPLAEPQYECRVNWSAFGTVSVRDAQEYALAILRAAQEAETWNRTHGPALNADVAAQRAKQMAAWDDTGK